MAHSNLLLSTAGKLGTVSPNWIGMSLEPIVTCSTTHFCTLMCHHIQVFLLRYDMLRWTI
jgi:hypothetical protein